MEGLGPPTGHWRTTVLDSGTTLTCPNSECTAVLQLLVSSTLGDSYRCACGGTLVPISGDLADFDLDGLDDLDLDGL